MVCEESGNQILETGGMSYGAKHERGDGIETARGYIHVCLTFEVRGTADQPEEIRDNVINYIDEAISKVQYPYSEMSLEHVEVEGDELDYQDWGYEDYVNHLEDTRDDR